MNIKSIQCPANIEDINVNQLKNQQNNDHFFVNQNLTKIMYLHVSVLYPQMSIYSLIQFYILNGKKQSKQIAVDLQILVSFTFITSYNFNKMENQQNNQVIVFEEEDIDDHIPTKQQPLQHQYPQEMGLIEDSQNHSEAMNGLEMYTPLTHDAKSEIVEIAGPEINKQIGLIQNKQPKDSNFVFVEQNAFSFRNPTPMHEIHYQKYAKESVESEVNVISDFNSETDKTDHKEKSSTEERTLNRRRSQKNSKFKDISDTKQMPQHKLVNKADHFKEAKRITPGLFQQPEDHHKTEDYLHHENHNVFDVPNDDVQEIRQSKVNRKKLPPLAQTKGQITISNSSAIQIDSSMLVLNKNEYKNKFGNTDSITQIMPHQFNEDADMSKCQQIALAIVPQKKTLKCLFQRQKNCCSNYYNPQYSLSLRDRTFIVNAKKQFGHLNSHYNITSKEKQFNRTDKEYLGFLKGNFVGSEFNIYQLIEGRQELVCTIIYETMLTCSSAYRVMEVYVKNQQCPYSELYGADQNNCGGQINLQQLYEMGENNSLMKINKYINKKPEWNSTLDCYILNFKGKSKLGSVKNMILINQQQPDNYLMLFCKTDKNNFYLQIGHPFTPFIAMGILMSSFDFKIFCQ